MLIVYEIAILINITIVDCLKSLTIEQFLPQNGQPPCRKRQVSIEFLRIRSQSKVLRFLQSNININTSEASTMASRSSRTWFNVSSSRTWILYSFKI
jgi:hypothetical protein